MATNQDETPTEAIIKVKNIGDDAKMDLEEGFDFNGQVFNIIQDIDYLDLDADPDFDEETVNIVWKNRLDFLLQNDKTIRITPVKGDGNVLLAQVKINNVRASKYMPVYSISEVKKPQKFFIHGNTIKVG